MNDLVVVVSKRNVPKQLIMPNDKFQFSSNINVSQPPTDSIERDDAQIMLLNNTVESTSIHLDQFQIATGSISITDEMMSVRELDRKLRLDKTILLIDTRDLRMFRIGHISGAEIFNCSTRILMLKAKKEFDKLKLERSTVGEIVLYNQRGDKTSHIMDFMNYLKEDCASVHFVRGGYEEYERCVPNGLIESSILEQKKIHPHFHSPTNESNRSTDIFNATMSEILPFLFLGNEMDSSDARVLQERKITHILNVTTDVRFYHENLFIYKRVSATDSSKQDMRAYYEESIDFIDGARSRNGKVLVHCWAGVSRSATIVAAYLMKHSKMNVLQTIRFIQSKRSIAEPNFNFLGQLERYYSDLERGIESRYKEFPFVSLGQIADKFTCEHDAMQDQKLSTSNSSSSTCSPTSPGKSYFNFIK